MSLAFYELCLNANQHAYKTKRGPRLIIEWSFARREFQDRHLDLYWNEETTDVMLFPEWGGGHHVLTTMAPFAFDGAKTTFHLTPRQVRWHLSTLIEKAPGEII